MAALLFGRLWALDSAFLSSAYENRRRDGESTDDDRRRESRRNERRTRREENEVGVVGIWCRRLRSWLAIDVSPRSAEAVAERRCEVLEVAADLVKELEAYLAVAAG